MNSPGPPSELDRDGHVLFPDRGRAGQIGHGATNPENAAVGTTAELPGAMGLGEQPGGGSSDPELSDFVRLCLPVGPTLSESLAHQFAGYQNPLSDRCRLFARRAGKRLGGRLRDRHHKVDAVDQRPAQGSPVAPG